MDISQRFANIRLRLGFNSQKKFADHLGVKKDAIADIERGKTQPRFYILEKLRTICKININYLIDGEGNCKIGESYGVSEDKAGYKNIYKDKYYELLEENRELRKRIDELKSNDDKKKEAS